MQEWIEKKNKETPKDLEGQHTSCEETIEHFERTPAPPTSQLCDKEIKFVETLLEQKKSFVQYNCALCKSHFPSKIELTDHFKTHQGYIPEGLKKAFWKSSSGKPYSLNLQRGKRKQIMITNNSNQESKKVRDMMVKPSNKALGPIGIIDIRNIKRIAKEIEEKAAQRK